MRNLRMHQCPGCWATGMFSLVPNGYIECDCGEKLTCVDLRDAPSEPSALRPERNEGAVPVQQDEWREKAFAALDSLKIANDNTERLAGRVGALIEVLRQVEQDIDAVPEYQLNPRTEEDVRKALAFVDGIASP